MPTSKRPRIPESTQKMLWGKTAGRCSICNKVLWQNFSTKEIVNIADVAHIIAFSQQGPRGHHKLSKELARDLTNFMLLCPECHITMDKNEKNYPVELLRKMKEDHERRIEIVADIPPGNQSEILLYGVNVGMHNSQLTYQKAALAMMPKWRPANPHPISLGMVNSTFRDYQDNFWQVESQHLRQIYHDHVKSRLMKENINHLSVFAFAPQPLLMLLGYLLADIPPAEIYQLHREPQDWQWQTSARSRNI